MDYELYHHGVLGQKWGVRRYQNADGSLTDAGRRRYGVETAREDYKKEREKYKSARKDFRKSARRAYGIKGISRYNEEKKKFEKVSKRYQKADQKLAVAKAEKRAGKYKENSRKEFKAYKKEMAKYGIRGSAMDISKNSKATALYDHIATKKGKEYADKVEKRVQTQAVTEFIAGTAVLIGASYLSRFIG